MLIGISGNEVPVKLALIEAQSCLGSLEHLHYGFVIGAVFVLQRIYILEEQGKLLRHVLCDDLRIYLRLDLRYFDCDVTPT